MIAPITKRWKFITAQTNLSIQACGASEYLAITYVAVTCANSNSVDVAVDLGIATTALPTITDDSATGGAGIAFSHSGIAKGGGAVATNGGQPLVVGAVGDPIRLSCTVPTGGSIRVIVAYRAVDTTPAA